MHYDSLYKSDFPEHEIKNEKIDDTTKKDLRKHHFKFGYGKTPQGTSNYHDDFTKKEVPNDMRKEFNDTKEQARASVNQFFLRLFRLKFGLIQTGILRLCMRKTTLKRVLILQRLGKRLKGNSLS